MVARRGEPRDGGQQLANRPRGATPWVDERFPTLGAEPVGCNVEQAKQAADQQQNDQDLHRFTSCSWAQRERNPATPRRCRGGDGSGQGRIEAMTVLPSSRALVLQLGASRGIVVEAFEQLVGGRYVRGAVGGFRGRLCLGSPGREAIADDRLVASATVAPIRAFGGHSMTETGATVAPDGIRIVFEAAGTGRPALVFVHGWSCDRTFWAEQVATFARAHRVVAVDLAGHGASGRGRTAWTMAAFGADVAAVVESLALDDVVLIGHSMGGDVVVEAALRLGRRVRGIVWVDTYDSLDVEEDDDLESFVKPFRRDFPTAVQAFVRTRLFLPATDPEVVDRVAATMASRPSSIAIDAMVHSVTNAAGAAAALRQIDAPVVSIHPAFRPPDEASLRRHGIEPIVMPEIGHFPMLEDPPRFDALLQEVLGRFAQGPTE
jgi:pimeloyl-ACP methyl ester carboxylesterase